MIISLSIAVVKLFSYRLKFKFTQRGIVNLFFFTVLFSVSFIIMLIFEKNLYICAVILLFFIISCPLVIKIFEKLPNYYFENKNKKYILQQSRKLSKINPIVIGITGSYGKTSCKQILNFFLSDVFKTVATEKNYNTEMGVAKSIEKMQDETEIFISEFGARRLGDIEKLCNLFPPQYGLLTGICEQHLKTFRTKENIISEKNKLALAVARNNGTCFFNTNNKYVLKLYKEYIGNKISIGYNKRGNIFASNIKITEYGSEFVINIDNKKYLCKTKLLGRSSVQNITMCVSVALNLGCPMENLVKKIAELPQIKHRLEHIEANGIHIIDDSYNGNINGIMCALEVLQKFIGRKIVVSQGIVELGRKTDELNYFIGTELANVADIIILTGPNAKYIRRGLESSGYSGKIIYVSKFKNVTKTIHNIIQQDDILLMQNDVPDIY